MRPCRHNYVLSDLLISVDNQCCRVGLKRKFSFSFFSRKFCANFFSLFAKKLTKIFGFAKVFTKIFGFAKVFAKIFHSEGESGFRNHLNVYPDPNTGGCYLKFSRKPSREQKFFAKTFAKTKISVKTFAKAKISKSERIFAYFRFSRIWKRGCRFNPIAEASFLRLRFQVRTKLMLLRLLPLQEANISFFFSLDKRDRLENLQQSV
jgi:hypothetical protein